MSIYKYQVTKSCDNDYNNNEFKLMFHKIWAFKNMIKMVQVKNFLKFQRAQSRFIFTLPVLGPIYKSFEKNGRPNEILNEFYDRS